MTTSVVRAPDCWRDHHHQVLADRPAATWEDHTDRGDDVRRWVPQLAGIDGGAVHRPWGLDDEDDVRAGLDHPPPSVDHHEAVARFRAARGLD